MFHESGVSQIHQPLFYNAHTWFCFAKHRRMSSASSSSVHGMSFRKVGSRWLRYRSRHCLAMRPGIWRARSDHCRCGAKSGKCASCRQRGGVSGTFRGDASCSEPRTKQTKKHTPNMHIRDNILVTTKKQDKSFSTEIETRKQL